VKVVSFLTERIQCGSNGKAMLCKHLFVSARLITGHDLT